MNQAPQKKNLSTGRFRWRGVVVLDLLAQLGLLAQEGSGAPLLPAAVQGDGTFLQDSDQRVVGVEGNTKKNRKDCKIESVEIVSIFYLISGGPIHRRTRLRALDRPSVHRLSVTRETRSFSKRHLDFPFFRFSIHF